MGHSRWIEIIARDVRYAVRRLGRSRGFTVVAALSLALGIGANTAAFGVLYAVLLRPLPVRDPGALAVVQQRRGGTQYSMAYPAYAYLRDHATRSIADVIAFRDTTVNLSDGRSTERVTGLLVSGNYFGALGIDTIAGSSITADDDRTPDTGGARGPVALLGEQYWARHFNRDPAIIGSVIRIQGEPLTVVGIVPARFRGTRVGALPDVFMPMMFATKIFGGPNTLTGATNNWLRIIIRKKPDATFTQAEAEMTVAYHQFNREFVLPIATTDQMRRRALDASIILEPGRAGLQEMRDRVSSPLFILMGLMVLVWLIASVNVAGLMVARAARDARDTAIQLALGASGARLWAQHLVESALLGAISVALGLVFATWMRSLLVQLVPARLELDLTLDQQVIAAALLFGLATTLLLGAVTGWQSTRRTIVPALKGDDVAARFWLRKLLIVGQLALSIVVLVAAGLFGQTLWNLRTADTGIEREHLLLASISPGAYPESRQGTFYTELLEKVRTVPGVLDVALSNDVPLDTNTGWTLRIPNEATGATTPVSSDVSFVSRDYFNTVGIPLRAGHPIEPGAPTHEPWLIVVNETFVRQYLGGRTSIGARIIGNGTMTFEIAGVARDSASRGFREQPEPLMYVPLEQKGFSRGLVLYVRSAVAPASLAATIETLIHRDDPDVSVRDVRTIEQHVDLVIGRERTFASLSSSFGLLALILSAIGLYGMLAYAVSRRTKELGIRLALGASPGRLVRMVLRDAGVLVLLGVAIGVPLASLLGGTIRGLLYGVQPSDWRSLAVAAVVLVAAALAAAWLPARRAAGVDPLIALRHE
jgi:putative ABC transport system permease protein